MELGLSLGDASKKVGFGLFKDNTAPNRSKNFEFSMSLGLNSEKENDEENYEDEEDESEGESHLQLNLLPLAPIPIPIPRQIQSLPWSSDNGSSENGSSPAAKGLDVNRVPAAEEVSSANSAGSPFGRMYRNSGNGKVHLKRDFEATGNDGETRASDDDENALNARKKLRLSKEQSAFLEESFKEHNTLNPKQKLALAKQLNLRPRQVEVWFQNRRARTKLKQTEVDCEYLKRCCETLTDENRRLHKEVQELRALKSSNSNPFYMQLPATTLTMCPSCERVAPAAQPTAVTVASTAVPKSHPFPLTRPRFFPFPQTPAHPNQPAAS